MSLPSFLSNYPERQLSKRPWEFWCGEGLSSWGVPREEFQHQNLNPCGVRTLKTWTPEEFQLEKPYLNPWGIPASKTLPKPLRNSSLKNLNHWGIPASKTWTCEEFQTQILTLREFQTQKYWSFRNFSLNCHPWGILGSKILSPEELQSDYFGISWKFVPLKNSRSIKWQHVPLKNSRVPRQGLCTY